MNANLQMIACRSVPTVEEATTVHVTSSSNLILLTGESVYVSLISVQMYFIVFWTSIYDHYKPSSRERRRMEKIDTGYRRRTWRFRPNCCSRFPNREVVSFSSLVLHLQHSFLLDHLMNFYLQPQTLVRLDMAVNTSASKDTITEQRVPVMLITSWEVMERLAEVLIFTMK